MEERGESEKCHLIGPTMSYIYIYILLYFNFKIVFYAPLSV